MRMLLNSVPKSGTHLLASLFAEMRPFRQMGPSINRKLALTPPRASKENVLVGVGSPRPVEASTLSDIFEKMGHYTYTTAHLPYSARAEQLLSDAGGRMILIVRDPLDVACSLVLYARKQPGNILHSAFSGRSMIDAVRHAIDGIAEGTLLLSLNAQFESVATWVKNPLCLPVTFEAMVGPKGGGCTHVQEMLIERLLKHSGLAAGQTRLKELAAACFNEGSPTFSKGIIGGWRLHFTDEEASTLRQRLVSAETIWRDIHMRCSGTGPFAARDCYG